ncbi:MAG TPA: branched-chain amino acid ABC transporter permease [Devosia sp.]|jgi:branched-chain amino acid transport system permease protein|nr:branched-chain amino acid ABC transporter permease [Devosia sp.]
MTRRVAIAYLLLVVLIVVIGATRGVSTAMLLTAISSIYALAALGLNIQFGFGGLFNLAIMGLLMIGGMTVSSVSMPINYAFWSSDGPMMLGRVVIAAAAGVLLVLGARRLGRLGVPPRAVTWLTVLAWFVAYVIYRLQIDPAAAYIETQVPGGWIGGLGLPVWVGYAIAGVLAGFAAWVIGKISLGLRSDYLAIATIGMSEIIRAFVKNMDWLTRGTLTVTPIPWPVPLPGSYIDSGIDIPTAFVFGQGGFVLVTLAILALAVFLVERAYGGPWGRMMRAVRDNHVAASSMGKDVKARQIEIFVFGAVLMGIAGALLSSFNQLFDPGGYIPINHTFLIWVMVIVGGMGNSYGAVLGGFLVYLLWAMSEPVSATIFGQVSNLTTAIGWGAIPEIDARAAQMRVFVLGFVIWLSLRYAPKGLIPEVIRRHV